MPNRQRTNLEIGQRLRDVRERLGIPQSEIARVLDIPRSAVSMIESGQRNLTALELALFVDHTAVSPYYLLGLIGRNP